MPISDSHANNISQSVVPFEKPAEKPATPAEIGAALEDGGMWAGVIAGLHKLDEMAAAQEAEKEGGT